MTARIGITIRANLVEVTEAWSSNAPCRSSLADDSETMATHFARLPRLLNAAASAAILLNRRTGPAILPTLRPPSVQSRVCDRLDFPIVREAFTQQLEQRPPGEIETRDERRAVRERECLARPTVDDCGTGFIECPDTLLDPLPVFHVCSDIAGNPFLQRTRFPLQLRRSRSRGNTGSCCRTAPRGPTAPDHLTRRPGGRTGRGRERRDLRREHAQQDHSSLRPHERRVSLLQVVVQGSRTSRPSARRASLSAPV